MLTLYSFGPGANSLKPMLTLYEKGLEFKIVRLNPANSSIMRTGSRQSIRTARSRLWSTTTR
jgi:hypothetical protein